MNGRDIVVKLLLEREDVNPDWPVRYGQIPLSLAAGGGCDGIVKLLLVRDGVSPDRQDHLARTPLSLAPATGVME